VTTFLDYYGLPSDFPGWGGRPVADAYARVGHLEAALAEEIDDPRFIPHLTLHELETWLYVQPSAAPWVFSEGVARQLVAIRNKSGGAESVNESPATAPSKRILSLAPLYAKTVDGPQAIEATGLDLIRRSCPHADAWLKRLEFLAS
jgi:hypothetical protein